MGPGIATVVCSLVARAVAAHTGGWEESRVQVRLFTLLNSRLGAWVVPATLAAGHIMSRSIGPGRGLFTAINAALGAAGVMGLHLGAGRGELDGEAALPLAAAGAAIGVGLAVAMGPVARASLAV